MIARGDKGRPGWIEIVLGELSGKGTMLVTNSINIHPNKTGQCYVIIFFYHQSTNSMFFVELLYIFRINEETLQLCRGGQYDKVIRCFVQFRK